MKHAWFEDEFEVSQWHKNHPCCVTCGTTARPYSCRGQCVRCRAKATSIARYEIIVNRVAQWRAMNPDKVKTYQAKANQRQRYGFAIGDRVAVPSLGNAVCIGKPRCVKGERVCDVLIDGWIEPLETTTEGIERLIG